MNRKKIYITTLMKKGKLMISEKSPHTKLSYENIDISPEKSQSDSSSLH